MFFIAGWSRGFIRSLTNLRRKHVTYSSDSFDIWIYFSPIPLLWTHHANPTEAWRQAGIYSPPVNIPLQRLSPWCLVGGTGRRRSRTTSTNSSPPRSDSRSRRRLNCGETQGQQCGHSSCSHPFWKRWLSLVTLHHLRRKKASVIQGTADHCVAVTHVQAVYEEHNSGTTYSHQIPTNEQELKDIWQLLWDKKRRRIQI